MAMDKKQKGLVVLTVVALGFLGYQVFQLVGGDMSQSVGSTQVPSLALNDDNNAIQPAQHVSWQAQQETPLQRKLKSPDFSMQNAKLVLPEAKSTIITASQQSNATSLDAQQQTFSGAMQRNQQAYLKMINEYELAKMQRQLLDEKAAIATAQNKIIVMNHKNQVIGGDTAEASPGGLTGDSSDHPFRLSYLDQQGGQWSATLARGDQYQQVGLGSVLPGNYKVMDINHNGVVLQQQNKRQLITFNGAVALSDVVAVPTDSGAVATVVQAKNNSAGAIHASLSQPLPMTHLAIARAELAHTADSKQSVVSTQAKQTLSLEQRAELVSAHYVSQRDAIEAPDTLFSYDDTRLPLGLHLRSVSLDPVVHEPYQSSNYLAPEQVLAKSYHLIDKESGVPNKYEEESVDTLSIEAPRVHLSEKSCGLLHQSGAAYVIQLMGTQDQKQLTAFTKKNHVTAGVMRCAAYDKQHHDWYMAFYGSYPSFADAESSLVNLPDRLRTKGAFVRKVSDVQQEVKQSA